MLVLGFVGSTGTGAVVFSSQLTDKTQTPNTAGEGIGLSLDQQIGGGRGSVLQPGTSLYLIARDPARAIRRGRQLFQRKFSLAQGVGPRTGGGTGPVELDPSPAAGLADSCAACHGRPRGAAGFGGDVFTRPDSRDAPHLFGLGLQEMLADEITNDLRGLRAAAIQEASNSGTPVTKRLRSKGIRYGSILARPDGTLDTSRVRGVNEDLRVRPFFAQGDTISIREFVVGALNAEMGLEAPDPDLCAATDPSAPSAITTPSGMFLDPALDTIEQPTVCDTGDDPDGDGVTNEIDAALVDFMEFYLLNYFKPGTGRQNRSTQAGFHMMDRIGCTQCHVRDLVIDRDRRVADVETEFDPRRGIFNRLFATARTLLHAEPDGTSPPPLRANGEAFVVRNIFADFKRHDLGRAFHERNFDGTYQTEFMTEPLWGVGSTAPYGHDGRSINLTEVILRHGGAARRSRNAFARLSRDERGWILDALGSLVLFPPDDTASNLNPGDPTLAGFPQLGHGKIDLSVLFTTPGVE